MYTHRPIHGKVVKIVKKRADCKRFLWWFFHGSQEVWRFYVYTSNLSKTNRRRSNLYFLVCNRDSLVSYMFAFMGKYNFPSIIIQYLVLVYVSYFVEPFRDVLRRVTVNNLWTCCNEICYLENLVWNVLFCTTFTKFNWNVCSPFGFPDTIVIFYVID